FPLEQHEAGAHVEPAQRYRYRDGHGDIGVIASVTEPFCESCDRVRITAEGQFRTCLFALEETDLRAIVRSEAPGRDDRLAEAIAAAAGPKGPRPPMGREAFDRPARSMSQIGG